MQITNPRSYVDIGAIIRYLCGCNEYAKLAGDVFIIANLKALKNLLEYLSFDVSMALFNLTLAPYLHRFEEESNEAHPQYRTTLGADAEKFTNTMVSFENTVLAESMTKLIASPIKRRFNIDDLLKSPDHLLGKGVHADLSDIAKADFNEACRCIAFECPTAAAFNLLRCVEECLRDVYKAYFLSKSPKNKPWGNLINELRNKSKKPQPDLTLLDHLDHLRNRFRNPTDHPEMIYNIEETEDLMHLCIDSIARCMRDKRVQEKIIKKRKIGP